MNWQNSSESKRKEVSTEIEELVAVELENIKDENKGEKYRNRID